MLWGFQWLASSPYGLSILSQEHSDFPEISCRREPSEGKELMFTSG